MGAREALRREGDAGRPHREMALLVYIGHGIPTPPMRTGVVPMTETDQECPEKLEQLEERAVQRNPEEGDFNGL